MELDKVARCTVLGVVAKARTHWPSRGQSSPAGDVRIQLVLQRVPNTQT